MNKELRVNIYDILGKIQHFTSEQSIACWEQFVKWCHFQFQSQRHIYFGKLGHYGYKIQERSLKKIPFLFFEQRYVKSLRLTLQQKINVLKPLVSVNYKAIAQRLEEEKLSKQDIEALLNTTISKLEQNLVNFACDSVWIDLGSMGVIKRDNNILYFEYILPQQIKPISKTDKKITLRNIIQSQENKFRASKMSMFGSKTIKLPKIESRKQLKQQKDAHALITKKNNQDKNFNTFYQVDNFSEKKISFRNTRTNSLQSLRIKSKSKEQVVKEDQPSGFRMTNRPSETLGWEMMGAGRDPLKKSQDYAKLAGDSTALIKTKFQFPKRQPIRSIPIIDIFARTLCCPIATQRQNPLVCARIGSNLTLSTQSFNITGQGIKYQTYTFETLTNRVKKKQIKILSDLQQYNLIVKAKRSRQQEELLEIKRSNYDRYKKLFIMIQQKQLQQFDSQTLVSILSNIDKKLEQQRSVKQMINQVIQGYQQAIKKSIIDYILLDPVQKDRLDIYIIYKPPIIYGTERSNFPTRKQNSIFDRNLPLIEVQLAKNCSNAARIQTQWIERYQQLPLLKLPDLFQKYINIEEFVEYQKITTKTVRQSILNEWIPNVSEIYKLQIGQLNREIEACQTFFQSTSMLLHIQIRKMIYKAMNQYYDFFKQYDQQILNPPDTVVHLQKTKNEYQMSFLSLRLSHKKDEIYFMDSLQQITEKMLNVIDRLRQFSFQIPRPQNLITKTQRLYLYKIPQDDHYYLWIRSEVQRIIKKNLQNTAKCLEIYNKYQFLLNEIKVVEEWIYVGNHDRREYTVIMNKYQSLYDQVLEQIPFFIRLNMVYIDSSELKNYFLKIINQISQKIQKSVYDIVFRKNDEIQEQLEKMIRVASTSATTCQILVQVQSSVDLYRRTTIRQLQNKSADLIKWVSITLYNTLYKTNQQDLRILHSTANFLHHIYQKLDEYDSQIFNYRKALEDQAKRQGTNVVNKTKKIYHEFQKLKECKSRMLKDEALKLIEYCRENINKLKKQLKDLNYRQNLLGIDQTNPTKLVQSDVQLKPFQQLWNLVTNYLSTSLSWAKQSIFTQDADLITTQSKMMYKSAVGLSNNVIIKKIAPDTLNVAIQLYQDIEKFQKNIPIIAVFSNPGLKSRHFDEINKLINLDGEPLTRSSNLNLNRALNLGAGKHIEELEVISEAASKQYMIETTLSKIDKQWIDIQFQMKQYKDSDAKLITGASIQQTQTLLDDHSLKVLSMKGSLFAKTFQTQLNNIEKWLNYTNQMIEYSTKVQSAWMYLQPVMTSPDILKHLSVEGSKFRVVDQVWRSITNHYQKQGYVKRITKDQKIVSKLKQCHANLQIVMKGLNSYLQSKRLSFPRFFFLSNQQLLEILSQTKDPTRVQPHLKKCFEGISRLQFQENKLILGMYSQENQYVHFTAKINTALARGNVDQWLLQVQQRMVNSVKRQIEQLHKMYTEKSRRQCLTQGCAMGVLTVQMTHWTKKIQESILQNALNQYAEVNKKLLKEVVDLIKTPGLKKVNIMTLQALIVLSVHNLDITENLAKAKISSISNFSWQSQLRYYFQEQSFAEGPFTKVKILNAICSFNHQYLGNTTRLVITPLTDRCYRTLCSAIYLNYGGAPQGPAGTGKTQTVKDLAKALACQCVVFNCSDGLDYKAMGKFFKGLAASGAWSCFDQFNRINLEVLSVVAQQILCIQVAKANGQSTLLFQDTQLPLKVSANCFITMNPGYAGRSELPDNLKALFRAVAMMIPDYAMIAQISLYSYGFIDARNLARKIVTTYKLCSEQLSSQQHYDYGMRAVKSVLVAAGNLKRKYFNIQENALVLKAINDVNVAKFLAFDIPLFNGITSDLFPGIEPPTINYDFLMQKIKQIFKEKSLTMKPYAMEKIIQIYDMILVRHGLMIVGYPFSGKSTALQILAEALHRSKDQMNEQSVQICKINPKSITMKQLYGFFDEISHQWFDGVLAVKFRSFASSTDLNRKWLLLDGPVDAIWIQNMNTVLDDNKKLCLNSGEIIAMSKSMSLVFEPMDLLAASPATVSRCGMIYMEPASLGFQVFLQAWLDNTVKQFPAQLLVILKEFLHLILPIYKEVQNLKTICFTTIYNLLHNFFHILENIIKQLRVRQNFSIFDSLEDRLKYSLVAGSFIFSVVWSFGGCIDTVSRKKFDIIFKKILAADQITNNKNPKRKLNTPQRGSLFDYSFSITIGQQSIKSEWIKWMDLIQDNSEQVKKQYSLPLHEIIVKTSDTIRYDLLVSLAIETKKPVILCGPTGTGKTTLIKSLYNQKINKKLFGFLQIIFSSKTACYQVQQQIQSQLDKRGGKSLIGPKKTQKIIIYIDDLNMPAKQQYGAQPPIQVLRQLLDQNGFYELKQKQKFFKKLTDVHFIYSMAAINNDVTPRFLRHINILSTTNFDEETLHRIFSTLLNISFHNHSQHKQINTLLKYCLEVYQECVTKLLPTPAKSHYIFNLRDLWKLVMGICRANKEKVHSENIGRLWAHQTKRIFMDRLLPQDKPIIENIIDHTSKKWGKNMNNVYFSDILSNPSQKSYQQVVDIEKVSLAATTALNNYNMVSDKPMDLVLFRYALEHILITLRIIRQPKGNALLVGMGGSGRKSFASLASFIAEYNIFTLQITKNYGFNQFREDIKKMFLQIGVKNKSISFVINDSQIKQQQFLQDINNLLNVGTVPNLFSAEQRIQICQNTRKDAAEQVVGELTIDQIFSFFLKRVKNQLRLILCFSPIGDSFRTRLRMFPSLVNCTTIDWFEQWPSEGLISVATKFLQKTQLKDKQKYIQMFEYFHKRSKYWSTKIYEELKRKFYITPTSFIEFITTFKSLLSEKRKQIKQLIYKYQNGYIKIVETQTSVQKMKLNLEAMKPELKKATQNTIIKMQLVKTQKQQADVIMDQIQGQEKVVLQAVNQANSIKQDCEQQLAVALPQLKKAEDALKVLNKNSLTQIKAMKNPPIAVVYVLKGLCLLLEPNPKQRIKNPQTLKMQIDWWSASLKLVSNPKLLEELVNFDKQELAENTVVNLGKFLNDPNNKDILAVSNVANSSQACQCIIQWVNGIYNFYFVNKKVKPKKQSLKLAEQKVMQLNAKLQSKRKELDDANKKVDQLNYELQWAKKNKQRLQTEYINCEIALKRAEIIISSLGDQKIRWRQLSEEFKAQQNYLDVEVFMACAQISYLGPFTPSYRSNINQQWIKQLLERSLKITKTFTLAKTLGNPIMIRQWNSNGLPYDNFSIQNAIIMKNSRRWPLMIDPQGQANKWLKKQQAKRKLKIIKLTEDNFIRNLQNCIQFGTPVLIQNLGQQITAALTPILLKQTYKKGATTYLKMGENVLIYSLDFSLYLTTKIRNPHYLPEICTQVVMINFMITQEGLADQLLGTLVSKQRPDLQQEKQRLVLQSSQNAKTLKQIEDQILNILNNAENILDDEKAINVLTASKQKSNEIKQKQQLAEQTEIQIDKARNQYEPVSKQASLLFFVLSELGNIEPMYQYSLTYFNDLFLLAIDKSQKADLLSIRLKNLQTYFVLNLFRNISRSLFQKDRLIFASLISLKLSHAEPQCLKFLLLPSLGYSSTLSKPKVQWLSQKVWQQICKLSQIVPFTDLLSSFNNEEDLSIYKKIIQSSSPFKVSLPNKYINFEPIHKLMLYKCLRPEKMIQGFTFFVQQTLGQEFVKSLPFDLQKIYPDSNVQTPILFILSPGSDPFISITNFAKAKNFDFESISLGQGQGPIAQRLIRQNFQKGGWVVLQNCHLATSWMGSLEKIIQDIEQQSSTIHKNFRLWLTSYPTQSFPQSVLQKALKITNEPPKGLKNNLMMSYYADPINNVEFFQSSLHGPVFKKLLYSLCFFNAVLQERRKFGPLGWNISYQFTQSDLRISSRQLKLYVDNMNKQVPFEALKYLIAQCNYGGRVTDQNDRRLLLTLLQDYFNNQVINNEFYNFGNTDDFVLPNTLSEYNDYLAYIERLPSFGSPQLVGLHANADITKDINEANSLLQTILSCSSGSSGNKGNQQKSIQEQMISIIYQILDPNRFPQLFDLEACLEKYPVLYQQSMNTVLNQQLSRYNRLLAVIKKTLQDLQKALKGEVVMSNDLEKMFRSMYQGKVPKLWASKSYPSLKPLASYVDDLFKRITFFRDWVKKGIPNSYWISGFFFTQSFLTGVLQNYSRKQKIPVDQLSFNFLFKKNQIQNASQGTKIYGLFFEGAGWDSQQQCLCQSNPRILYVQCPTIYLQPTKTIDIVKQKVYETPLYKTLERRGILSTTGHSTNFVMMVKTPTKDPSSHWIKRGVALLTQMST